MFYISRRASPAGGSGCLQCVRCYAAECAAMRLRAAACLQLLEELQRHAVGINVFSLCEVLARRKRTQLAKQAVRASLAYYLIV